PELGNLFAQCMAKQFQQILTGLESALILELGAGTGSFCVDCMIALDALGCLPEKYYILEISADLQQRQKQKVKTLPEHLKQRIQWLSQPPINDFNGIVFANEVVDALAVEVFKYEQHQFKQMRVHWEQEFKSSWQPMPTPLAQQLSAKNLQLDEGYVSEFIPHLSSWLLTVSKNLRKGLVLMVDYGYERSAYYHPQRNQGTLVCYHQHQANFNYFSRIGIQDITAFVDFTALAEAADDCGLSVDGYTTQSHLLMSLGIGEMLGDSENDYKNYYKKTTEMKKLTMPNEMGEKFKVMALSRDINTELRGFTFSNQLHLL
ncbi:MAG TPA: SAM-dependent methyltransferase, partial [Oceanospirillales bacterium]|nr:SAM-dependent methyltransferase [Oceanospirillales bacterium]